MGATNNPYEQDLDKNAANYAPLTPLSFIERAAYVYPERVALVHGARRATWKETYARCRRLGSALAKRGIGPGDTVAAMLPNIPEMYEAHFGVPMSGAVLNAAGLPGMLVFFGACVGFMLLFVLLRRWDAAREKNNDEEE